MKLQKIYRVRYHDNLVLVEESLEEWIVDFKREAFEGKGLEMNRCI